MELWGRARIWALWRASKCAKPAIFAALAGLNLAWAAGWIGLAWWWCGSGSSETGGWRAFTSFDMDALARMRPWTMFGVGAWLEIEMCLAAMAAALTPVVIVARCSKDAAPAVRGLAGEIEARAFERWTARREAGEIERAIGGAGGERRSARRRL